MAVTFHTLRTTGFVGAMLAATAFALAQQPQSPQRQAPRPADPKAAPQQPRQQQFGQQRVTANKPVAQAGAADQTIAQCLAVQNQEEIALARLAASKAQDKKVREFADTLIKDHTNLLNQLERFGGQVASLEEEGGRRPPSNAPGAQQQTSASQQQQPGQTQQPGHAGGLNFLEIERQVAQMCLADAQREWSEKKPDEAEQCYLGGQVVAHQKLINGQKVLRQYASPELQAVLDKGIEAAQSHMDRAKELLQASIKSDNRSSDSKS